MTYIVCLQDFCGTLNRWTKTNTGLHGLISINLKMKTAWVSNHCFMSQKLYFLSCDGLLEPKRHCGPILCGTKYYKKK